MEDMNRKQLFWTRLTALFAGLCAAALVALALVFGAAVRDVRAELPKIRTAVEKWEGVADQASKALGGTDKLIGDLNAMVSDASGITDDLRKAAGDISEITASLNDNVSRLADALEQFPEIDVAGLNDSIEKLKKTVDPLSRLLGVG